MWEMLSTEYEQKTSLVQADLRAKFHSYRCPEKGDIRVHLNRLHQMHMDLQNIGVIIEDKDYAAIIMQSIPSAYADFCANIAAAAQLVMVDLTCTTCPTTEGCCLQCGFFESTIPEFGQKS